MFKSFSKFKNDTQGNVAMILAIALIPLMGFVGYAVDYNEASRQRAMLQSASDMAALYIAKLDDPEKQSKAQQLATDIVKKIAKDSKVLNLQVSGSIDGDGVRVTAKGDNPNTFAKIFGHDVTPVGVIAAAKTTMARLDIGLVLDVSTSMLDDDETVLSGIKALRPATHSLLTMLEDKVSSGRAKFKVSFNSFDHNTQLDIPLTDDFKTLKNHALDDMNPKDPRKGESPGQTNIGKAVLASHEHLKKGENKVKKVMIVLTDGAESYCEPKLGRDCSAYPDERHLWMPLSCPKVKADPNITIYMIGLGDPKIIEPKKLIDCAGSEKRYFPVEDYTKLEETFKKIFAELQALRLTK